MPNSLKKEANANFNFSVNTVLLCHHYCRRRYYSIQSPNLNWQCFEIFVYKPIFERKGEFENHFLSQFHKKATKVRLVYEVSSNATAPFFNNLFYLLHILISKFICCIVFYHLNRVVSIPGIENTCRRIWLHGSYPTSLV